tara:strand:+ start:3038 stop:3331 length:294 start_codon:yes stop_codon:yes gene_type:complete
MPIDLKKLKDRIEKMTKHNQIEVLRILSKNKQVNINENNNGSFINLTELDISVIQILNNYISYVDEQERSLDYVENEKERLENTFFKDNKDNEIIYT